jgi:aspartate racemase
LTLRRAASRGIEGGMHKHIGILAHSAEGSALCYLTACHEGIAALGPHLHPEITMSLLPMGQSMPAWEAGDLATVRKTLADTAHRLAGARCDFWACPDNTAHIALEEPGPAYPLPGLHIAQVVAETAKARGFKRLALLGTNWTMNGPVYRRAAERAGLEIRVPTPDDRALVHRVIFDELCNGKFLPAARAEYVRIIAQLQAEGCDAVVLGCTEIPLLITPGVSPLPTLDSTRLLAKAAVEVAIGKRPMPTWRGGPV